MSNIKQVSGEYYDWKKTRQPERPWIHQYHQTLVDKIYLATKANSESGAPSQAHLTFEQALERIQHIDRITRGIPKITYLVGWSFDGLDGKFPAWSEVNERLKRPQDPTARESLIWLMQEAFKYNTTVSLHINMLDAYPNSPLWQTYVDKDVLVKENGKFYECPWAKWGGEQAYWIDFAKEWDAGLAQKRIDGLMAMLPIKEAGTVHIDAFFPSSLENLEPQKSAMRKIFRYFRDYGVDVTSELMFRFRHGEAFIGLQPMAWHISNTDWEYSIDKPEVSEETWMEIPAALYCGGVDHVELKIGQLFGTSMNGEFIEVKDYLEPFCLQTLPWYFLNRFEREKLERNGKSRRLYLTEGVVSQVENGRRSIYHNQRLVVDGTDLCIPALWRSNRELIAYSKDGYDSRTWTLPTDWNDVAKVDVYRINAEGLSWLVSKEVEEGTISLSLDAGQAASIVPAGTAMCRHCT